jgi:hypothetical protein
MLDAKKMSEGAGRRGSSNKHWVAPGDITMRGDRFCGGDASYAPNLPLAHGAAAPPNAEHEGELRRVHASRQQFLDLGGLGLQLMLLGYSLQTSQRVCRQGGPQAQAWETAFLPGPMHSDAIQTSAWHVHD